MNPAGLALYPRLGDDKVGWFRRFFVGRRMLVSGPAPSRACPSCPGPEPGRGGTKGPSRAQLGSCRWSPPRGLSKERVDERRLKIRSVRWPDQIRLCQRLSLCGLLCLALHGLAIAQSETSAQPQKTPQTSAKPTEKPKHATSTRATSKRTSSHTTKSSHAKRAPKKRGQQAIDSARARQIQIALIREHYMQGEPTGSWDAATQSAMQRYQADQGWQSKTTPDSRALIKLGLGPSHDHLLNPESAMTTPTPSSADPKATTNTAPAADNIPKQ